MRLGMGGRFKKMVAAIEAKGKNVRSASAIAAVIGRKKYGKKMILLR